MMGADRADTARLAEFLGHSSAPRWTPGPRLIPAARARAARVRRHPPGWLPAVAVAGGIALLLGLPFVMQLQADSYKALYDGRWIVEHGIPHREALTVMAHGRAWIDQQWLAEVVFFKVWRIGGDGAVALASLLLVALAYMMLAGLMYRRGASVGVIIACTTVALLTIGGWDFPRAQDLALPLFAGLLAICSSDARHARPQRRLLLLIPLLVLWANVHGSVLLGATFAVAYVLYRGVGSARAGRRRSAAACGALALMLGIAAMATPYGTGIISYYREFTGNPAMARMAIEWAPAKPGSLAFFELCLPALLVVIALALAARQRSRPPTVILLALAITGAAAFVEAGSIIWFGMAAAILIADVAARRRSAWPLDRRLNVLVTVLATAVCALVMTQVMTTANATYESLVPKRVIAAAVTYASTHPCARILGDNLSSSALLWQAPSLADRIAFDARLEQYRPSALSRFAGFQGASSRGWLATTKGFRVLVGDASYAPALVGRLERMRNASVLVRQAGGVAVINNADAASSRCARGEGPAS